MNKLLSHFRLDGEKEEVSTVIENINNGVEFKGTNLWILVFAIFIASLGLNVNSTAVVIGAMLISPIMGPIIGLGFGMAINDLTLLKKAASNYLLAIAVGLATSTIFFSLSPLNDASSEILARTSPNIYDVLIALFGGFAGIFAVASKRKGNVIPGVAIATALMPPLCTAGYGLANWNLSFFVGALYLFVINTVFISFATMITARFLHFGFKEFPEKGEAVFAKRIVWIVVILTTLPSIYFGYDIVQQTRFRQRANQFINNEAVFPNDYLLRKEINAKKAVISLTYGGAPIQEAEIEKLKARLANYDLASADLVVLQGFAYLQDKSDTAAVDQSKKINSLLNEKDKEIGDQKAQIDAVNANRSIGKQIFAELNVQYPQITSCIIQTVVSYDENGPTNGWLAVITSTAKIDRKTASTIEDWLKVRVGTDEMSVFFQPQLPPKQPTVPTKDGNTQSVAK